MASSWVACDDELLLVVEELEELEVLELSSACAGAGLSGPAFAPVAILMMRAKLKTIVVAIAAGLG